MMQPVVLRARFLCGADRGASVEAESFVCLRRRSENVIEAVTRYNTSLRNRLYRVGQKFLNAQKCKQGSKRYARRNARHNTRRSSIRSK